MYQGPENTQKRADIPRSNITHHHAAEHIAVLGYEPWKIYE